MDAASHTTPTDFDRPQFHCIKNPLQKYLNQFLQPVMDPIHIFFKILITNIIKDYARTIPVGIVWSFVHLHKFS